MEEKEKLYKPIDYARLLKVTPAAVTKMIDTNRVKVVLLSGRRYIKA